MKELPSAKLWKLERPGLLSLPEEEQTRIVRGYFPKPSAEEFILVRLLLAGATSSETAVKVSGSVSELMEAGWVRSSRRGRGHYLTGLRLTIARGAVKTYPELASRTR